MNRARILCIAVAALVALPACKRDAPPAPVAPHPAPQTSQPEPQATKPVERPALKVETLDGATFDLAAHRGQWVVVNYWATWCSPCLKEMPELSALDAMREHVTVVGLAYEDSTPDAMRAFLQEHPVVYPVALIDVYNPPADFDTPRGLPLTYLIAPDGRSARRYTGPVSARMLEEGIAEAGGPKLG